MEAAGLSLAATQIVAQFQSCLMLYDQVMRLKAFDTDVQYFVLSLDREKFKLEQLKEIVAQSKRGQTDIWIAKTLPVVETTLNTLVALVKKHAGVPQEPEVKPRDAGEAETREGSKAKSTSVSLSKAKIFKPTFLRTGLRKSSWIASDKVRVQELVDRLRVLNDDLEGLVPEVKRVGLEYRLVAAPLAAVDIASDIKALQAVSCTVYPDISRGAQIKAMGMQVSGSIMVSA